MMYSHSSVTEEEAGEEGPDKLVLIAEFTL
jgi:hypothetical protein